MNHCRKALAIRQEILGPDHPDTAVALACEGRSLLGLGRTTEARRALEEAVKRLDQHAVPSATRGLARAALARSLPTADISTAKRLAQKARSELDLPILGVTDELERLDQWEQTLGSPSIGD